MRTDITAAVGGKMSRCGEEAEAVRWEARGKKQKEPWCVGDIRI